MAVGDGGFKQVAFGFDKNEVNTYISDLRKKMKSMEEDMKANDKKTAEAEKLAEEADERIKAAVKEGEDKCAELESRLSAADSKAEKLEAEVDKLKKELQDERKKMSDMLLSGKGVSAEANKAYTEIIDKAKADADDIVSSANAKAADIVAAANASCEGVNARTAEFLDAVKVQIEALTAGYNTINASAAQLLGAEIPEVQPVKLDIPAAAAQPAAAPAVVEETVVEEISAPAPVAEPEPAEEVVSEITASEEVMEVKPSSEDMPAITEADKEAGDGLASFDDVWGGNELAQTIYNNEKKDAVPLVNPEAKDLFGNDLFAADSEAENDRSADFTQPQEDDMVDEVKPLDVSDIADAKFDNGFDNDLLAQTMPSNALEGMDDALLEALKAAEAAFAVQPANSELSDFDMNEQEEEPAVNTEDELMKALREAEQALNNLAPADIEEDNSADSAADSSSDSSNPWADLQKQLEDMEQSGTFATETDISTDDEPSASDDPAAPSADDSSIWNFGSSTNSSSDDDDMSGDMFGGFGGF